jgi:hypothetical protein
MGLQTDISYQSVESFYNVENRRGMLPDFRRRLHISDFPISYFSIDKDAVSYKLLEQHLVSGSTLFADGALSCIVLLALLMVAAAAAGFIFPLVSHFVERCQRKVCTAEVS